MLKVINIKCFDANGIVQINMVMAKTIVAPIPSWELCGVLLAKLLKCVTEAIKMPF